MTSRDAHVDVESFAEHLRDDVEAKCGASILGDDSSGSLLREEAFTEWALELLMEHDEVSEWALCSFEAKGGSQSPAARLSAWALSGDHATLDLFVSHYVTARGVTHLGKPDLQRLFTLGVGFLDRALAGKHVLMEESSDAFHITESVHAARTTLTSVRVIVLTNCVARTLNIETPERDSLDVKFIAWDLEKLAGLRVGERSEIAIDLAGEYSGAVRCLEAPISEGGYRTYLAFFGADIIADIYGDHGQRLLERNVRAFLQTKGKVNKGLQTTLREEPLRFLAYNNGLCCTARSVVVAPGADGQLALHRIDDFQVVNGGQTTASLFHAKRKEKLDLSGVSVQVKLTVIDDHNDVAEMVPLIARFANSQNKVNTADFSANGKFHRDIESMSRTVPAPAASGLDRGTFWYYERARGSYLDDKARQGTPARQKAWAIKHPPAQRFSKTDLAKYEHSWLGLPHFVCLGAEKNFQKFVTRLDEDGSPSVDQLLFEQIVARAILWKSCERIFTQQRLVGHRANSVAYAFALVAEQTHRRIDLTAIWKAQDVSGPLSELLAMAVKLAHAFLTALPGNVGEASKKPATWVHFKETPLAVPLSLTKTFVAQGVQGYSSAKVHSPESQEARNSIGHLGPEFWYGLSSWAKDHQVLQPWQRSLAFSLGKLAARGGQPSPKQAIQGALIVQRAAELGYGPEVK